MLKATLSALFIGTILVASDTQAPTQTTQTVRPLEILVSGADSIIVGEVNSIVEKVEHLTLDGIASPFRVVTLTFKKLETLKGVRNRNSIRQYSGAYRPNNWREGGEYLIFLGKPTTLDFDVILPEGHFWLDKNNDFRLVHNDIFVPIQLAFVRDLVQKARREW